MNENLDRDDENNKNDHPIASREAIYTSLESPLDFKTLFKTLNSPEWAYDALSKRVDAMERDQQLKKIDGVIYQNGQSKLVTVKSFFDKVMGMQVSIDGMHLPLTERQAQGVFPGDELTIRVPDPVHPEAIAIVTQINTLNQNHIVCRVGSYRGRVQVLPFDPKIKQSLVLHKKDTVQEGEIVMVSRLQKQTSKKFLMVKIEKRLGDQHTPGIEREIAKSLFKLPGPWAETILEGADQESIEQAAESRTSWTDLPLVTIDGIDAKDYDDAVYVEKTDTGYRLYVAIADVSHYVKKDGYLDQEAKKRGNSVYFPGYVIPMLPEVLSNNICSLVPDQHRLAMGCCIDFDHKGNRMHTRLDRVVIRSHARLVYEDVDAMLSDTALVPEWWQAPLQAMNELTQCLRQKRKKSGTIILTSRETKFEFDDYGEIDTVLELERGWSHQMIEECMLAANMAVGYVMHCEHRPIIYRCHNQPTAEKIEQFKDYVAFHQIDFPEEPTAKDFLNVIEACQHLPDCRAVEMMVLRTLSQAYYCDSDSGHFALSTEYYTHFTSPIRRYVDLTVHRAIGDYLDNKPNALEEGVSAQCSMMERKADEASWFAQGWLKAKWAAPHVGKTFNAKISSVTHFGAFVALEDLPIEGLIHISNLGNEYFAHHPETLTLEGRSSGVVYGLGQTLKVRLKSVDIAALQVDFIPVA